MELREILKELCVINGASGDERLSAAISSKK